MAWQNKQAPRIGLASSWLQSGFQFRGIKSRTGHQLDASF
jgi:hypothetical protein